MSSHSQSLLFRGVYEFDDPSGCLIAARVPYRGSVDLYSDTAVLVKPNQCALFIYKGELADVLLEGLHKIQTENIPLITRLANWRYGLESPLRCELWFFSSQIYTARRWGTSKPVIHNFDNVNTVPIRAYGNYNIAITDPKRVYQNLIGSRMSYDITELESFVQGQILELLPEALQQVKRIEVLNSSQDGVSKKLQIIVNRVLDKYGLKIVELQVLSLLPSDEILKAMDSKAAMEIVGDKQEYLLYQAATSFNQLAGGKGENHSNDPMQMMLGLMLGKGLLASDFRKKEQIASRSSNPGTENKKGNYGTKFCSACGSKVGFNHNFCSSCGEKQS